MKIFEEMLAEPSENSIFVTNLNPIRTGLILYKTIDEMAIKFNYS